MSKAQVARDYQKLLDDRQKRIESDRPKTFWGRLLEKGIVRYYPMPLMPLDEDFRKAEK